MKKIVTLAIAIALFTCSLASADTLRKPPDTLRRPIESNGYIPQVYDSQGRRIGPMVSPNIVLMQLNGRWFGLAVGASGFQNAGSVNMMYESSDCSGTPYMHVSSNPLIEENAMITPENYLVYPGKSVVHMYANSTMPCTDYPYDETTAAVSQCSQISSTEMDAAPMEDIDLSRISVRPPFSLR